MNATPSEPPEEEKNAPNLSNVGRLRAHLTPDGLANTLLAVWKKEDTESQGKMLTALHDFFKPKQAS